MSIKTSRLPAGWAKVAGRVQHPRAEDAPADPKKDPKAAEPRRCPACEAEVSADAKYCAACGKELPEPEAEEKQAPEPPPAAAAAFARHALAVTKTQTLDAARGTIAAWREQAGKAATLAAELGDKAARLATIERERLLERAVAEGRLEPSEAWSFSVDKEGQKVRSFSEWAGPANAQTGKGQSLEQLAAFVATRPAASATAPARSFTPAPKTHKPAAAPPGLNADAYAAASNQVAEQLG